MINELVRIVLKTDLPEYGLEVGEIGNVVRVRPGDRKYDQES